MVLFSQMIVFLISQSFVSEMIVNIRTTISDFGGTVLIYISIGISHFIALCRYRVFLQIEGCSNPASRKSIGTTFPTTFAHFMSLCHVLVILPIFQTLHQQKDYNSLEAQMMVFSNEVFLN